MKISDVCIELVLFHLQMLIILLTLWTLFLKTPYIIVPTGAPANVVIMEKTETTLRISWDGIACGSRGGDIQHYVYQFEAEAQNAVSMMTLDRSIERSNLPCNTRYRFRVAGVNEVGMGPFSDDLEAITDFSSGKLNFTLLIISRN